MPVFRYRGRDQRGEVVTGNLEAANSGAVANQLMGTGITPIDINEGGEITSPLDALKGLFQTSKVDITDMIFFSRQMYTLLKAGVPIMQALRGLQETTGNPALAKVIGSIYNSLDAGLDLSTAMRRHSDVFPNLYVNLVQVGENSGTLEQVFDQLSGYLEREKETRQRIKSATRYPIFVVIAIAIALTVVTLFVIPKFAELFSRFNLELPWATKVLVATSAFMVNSWYVLLGAVVAATVGIRTYVQTPGGRYRWHKYRIRIPVVGPIIFKSTMARFARSLSMTIRAGVSLIHAMTLISRSVDNDYIGERVAGMRNGIERGETISQTARTTGMFPPMVLQMMNVGEEAGMLDNLLDEVGEYYERESDVDIKNLSQAIEPILIIFVGILVLILALGVFMPMWDMVQIARR